MAKAPKLRPPQASVLHLCYELLQSIGADVYPAPCRRRL